MSKYMVLNEISAEGINCTCLNRTINNNNYEQTIMNL